MSTNAEEAHRTKSALDDHRRWLIGIVISILFGLFSVIMTLITYTSSRGTPAPVDAPAAVAPEPSLAPAAVAPKPTPTPAAGKGKGKKGHHE